MNTATIKAPQPLTTKQRHVLLYLRAFLNHNHCLPPAVCIAGAFGWRSLHRPIGTITTRDRHAVIDGERMRMLSVPEARAAMGFPASYVLPDNQRTAMHMLGNAVCPPVARDVINAIREQA
jgi:site-specific DNA-cytosine methylase